MSQSSIPIIVAQAVAASESEASDAIPMEVQLSQIYIYVKNLGASTNLTVLIESSPDAAGTMKAPLQTFTLNTTTRVGSVPVSVVPAYLFFTATNSDAVNATTYSVTISKKA
jgi:hypothetical protein